MHVESNKQEIILVRKHNVTRQTKKNIFAVHRLWDRIDFMHELLERISLDRKMFKEKSSSQ